jgi:hypothetical protein
MDFYNRDQSETLKQLLNGKINLSSLPEKEKLKVLQPQLFLFVDKDRQTRWDSLIKIPKSITKTDLTFYLGMFVILIALIISLN